VSVGGSAVDVGDAAAVGDTVVGVGCSPHATTKADTTRASTIAKP
jgi:hypothetical protein